MKPTHRSKAFKVRNINFLLLQHTHSLEAPRFAIEHVGGVPIISLHSLKLIHACHQFFGATGFKFEASQVYVAMIAKYKKSFLDESEEKSLCWAMRSRLCHDQVYDSEEGFLIRIALALKRRVIYMKIQQQQSIGAALKEIPEQKVIFEEVQPLYGPLLKPIETYSVTVSFIDYTKTVFTDKTLGEIAKAIRFPK